jgi:hypothetical protein
MLSRIALLASALLLIAPAFATNTAPSSPEICRQVIPTIRDLWQHEFYSAPSGVAAVMVDAIDGNLPRVRQGLAALPVADQAHWRQVAMLTAANTYQPTVVDGLLDDGAAVDGTVRLPPFKQAFYRQTVDAMGHDPRFGRPATDKTLQSSGLADNNGNLIGPALSLVVACGDTSTLDVLLRHHANVMAREAPNVGDALTAAVVEGNAPIVNRLLDHGADVCMDNHHIRKPDTTLASIGRHNHLSDALVQRLTCHPTTTVH